MRPPHPATFPPHNSTPSPNKPAHLPPRSHPQPLPISPTRLPHFLTSSFPFRPSINTARCHPTPPPSYRVQTTPTASNALVHTPPPLRIVSKTQSPITFPHHPWPSYYTTSTPIHVFPHPIQLATSPYPPANRPPPTHTPPLPRPPSRTSAPRHAPLATHPRCAPAITPTTIDPSSPPRCHQTDHSLPFPFPFPYCGACIRT